MTPATQLDLVVFAIKKLSNSISVAVPFFILSSLSYKAGRDSTALISDSSFDVRKTKTEKAQSYVSALGQLRAVLYYALKLINYSHDGELFADETLLNSEIAEHLMLEVESLSQECFFGRCLGFQFCESMQKPMQALAIAMASYSEGYLESSHMMQFASSVFNSGKYFMDPELRAQQVVKVTRTADIRFCKAFWGFSESGIMHQLPSFVCPTVMVNEVITLGPDAFELPLVDGSDTVVITPPCAHTGPGHVQVRLISGYLLEGQQVFKKVAVDPKPRTGSLVIHIHGGGFVAQSSKSHEVYLRHWAMSLATPILSIDYSLAPELPFPRALEDCFYAYAWAVQNCNQLGSTGEKIILVGDSAGGNLATSTAMRAASFGIRRPDGIVAVYPSMLIKYTPSPARLISLLDPILPVGLVSRCLAAYAGINEQHPLAAPKMQDVHSEHSLTSLQIRSYETTDSDDWIIIAEDEDEANLIRTCTAEMKSPGVGTKSVIDSLEDSFTGESLSQRGSLASCGRSGTEDSVDSEIVSQLPPDTGCTSQPEVPTSTGKSRLLQTSGSTDDVICPQEMVRTESHPDSVKKADTGGSSSNFSSLFQEKAKTMLTTLSSYIPNTPDLTSRDVMGSLSTLLPTSSSLRSAAHPVTDYCDTDYLSDSVDVLPSTDAGEESKATTESLTRATDTAGSPSMLGDQEESVQVSDLKNVSVESRPSDVSLQVESKGTHLRSSPSQEYCVDKSSSPVIEESEPIQAIDDTGTRILERTNLSSDAMTAHSKRDDSVIDWIPSDRERHISCVDLNAQSESLSSISSPLFTHTDSTHCNGSVSPFNATLCPNGGMSLGERPYVGISPLSEMHSDSPEGTEQCCKGPSGSTKKNSDNNCPRLEVSPAVIEPCLLKDISSVARDGISGSNIPAGQQICCDVSYGATSSLPDLVDTNGHLDLNGVATCDSSPPNLFATFSEVDLDEGPVSPSALPSLPQASKQLLDDALLGLELPAVDTHVQKTSLQNSLIPDIGNSPAPPSGNCLDSEAPKTSQAGDTAHVASVESGGMEHSGVATLGQPKPPSSLSLKTTTTVARDKALSPSSPSAVFPLDESESFESVELELTFDSSRLEVQFQCPNSEAEKDKEDGIFRSESAPALSSMLSPEPSSSSGINTEFPNGLKTGMSPSDFKRENFRGQSSLHSLRKARVVENPYMSPLLASEELLVGLPPVCIVATHLDPLLDDSIMFARRLRDLGLSVELNLIDDLPHGFLNFALISKEAKDAADFCCSKISEML